MTTPIKIGPVSKGHGVRIASRTHGRAELNTEHLKEGQTWSGYVYPGFELKISEVDVSDPIIGRTHIGKLASSP